MKWFSQSGWDEAESGTADTLSRATASRVGGALTPPPAQGSLDFDDED